MVISSYWRQGQNDEASGRERREAFCGDTKCEGQPKRWARGTSILESRCLQFHAETFRVTLQLNSSDQ